MDILTAKGDMIQALEALLEQARVGRITGIAAVVHYHEGGYGTLLSHASEWNPLLILGGVARLERYIHTVADYSGG